MAERAIKWKRERLPAWLKQPLLPSAAGERVNTILRREGLHTICEEARCPNRHHCYSRGTATFLILGEHCTRSCPFCSVKGGPADPPDPHEPQRVLQAVLDMGLQHVVITSVNRDDLPDQGSGHFARCIEAIQEAAPTVRIEVLIPDFRGVDEDIDRVLEAGPNILNHNMETVSRLYRRVRPGARYQRSLDLLRRSREHAGCEWAKSGFMLGLGERDDEIQTLLEDLLEHGCQIVTIGQYLSPSPDHLPVEEYVKPAKFEEWERRGLAMGFDMVFAGPFVRSSYMADIQVPGS